MADTTKTTDTKTENALQQTQASTGATTTARQAVKPEDMKLYVVRDATGREVIAVISTSGSISAHRNRTDNTIEILDDETVVNKATLMAGNYSEPYTFDVFNDVNADRLTTEPDSSADLDVKDEDEEQDLEELNEQRRQDAVRRGLPPETAGPVTTKAKDEQKAAEQTK